MVRTTNVQLILRTYLIGFPIPLAYGVLEQAPMMDGYSAKQAAIYSTEMDWERPTLDLEHSAYSGYMAASSADLHW